MWWGRTKTPALESGTEREQQVPEKREAVSVLPSTGPLHEVLFLARMLLGAIMMYHGWPKMKDLSSTANEFDQMGFKPGAFWGSLIAGVEFIGGISILLGIAPWVAESLFGMQMLTGMAWKIGPAKKSFSDYSYDMLLLVLVLFLLIHGPDRYSMDSLLRE
jgi:putative oxidoreductase